MTKRHIEIAAESGYGPFGSLLSGADVARVSRDRRVVTLRHVWPDDTDARVWHGVEQAAYTLAREVVRRTGRPVSILTAEGWCVDQVTPDDAD